MPVTVYLLIVALMALVVPSPQEARTTVFFLARSDTNQDGLIDLDDENRLYASSAEGELLSLSQPGINVIQYTSRPDGLLVSYSWREGEEILVETEDVTDQTILSRVQIDDLENIRFTLHASGLWITGTNVDNLPVIRGIDPTNGQQIAERIMRRPETQIEMHHSGNWIWAFNLEAGALSVLQVPSLQGVAFEVSGYAEGIPAWSPVGEKLLIGSRSIDNPDDLCALVVDLPTLSTTRYDLPDYPVGTRIEWQWSNYGQYIQIQAETPSGNPTLPRLAFLRLADGTLLSVADHQVDLVWEWAAQDRAAIVSHGPALGEAQQIGLRFDLYDPVQNTVKSIPSTADFQTFNVRWNPNGGTLAMLAQSIQSGLFGLYIVDPASEQGEVTTYFETTNARISQGRLDWSLDGSKIIFVVPTDSLLFTSLGFTWAAFVLDLETQTVTRISSDDSVVDVLQIQIR